jgi:hypothetical protein
MKVAQRKKSKHKLRNEMHSLVDETIAQVAAECVGEKRLLRELRAEAMSRVERSAKTEAEFQIIVNAWDLQDKNRAKIDEKRLVPLYNTKTDTDTGDVEEIDEVVFCTDTVFPIPFSSTLRTRYWRQIMSGNFLDYICDCAYKMHGSVTSKAVAKAIEQLTDNQKEILYMYAIEGKTPQQIADFRGQTARNIRKVYNTAIESIHKRLGIEPNSNTENKTKDYKKGKAEK